MSAKEECERWTEGEKCKIVVWKWTEGEVCRKAVSEGQKDGSKGQKPGEWWTQGYGMEDRQEEGSECGQVRRRGVNVEWE